MARHIFVKRHIVRVNGWQQQREQLGVLEHMCEYCNLTDLCHSGLGKSNQ